jgi:hypothetical protein
MAWHFGHHQSLCVDTDVLTQPWRDTTLQTMVVASRASSGVLQIPHGTGMGLLRGQPKLLLLTLFL